jgi:cytochrome P450
VSRLLAVSEHADHLDGRELESTVGILMVAGHGATASLLGNSFLASQRHPEAKDRLRTEPPSQRMQPRSYSFSTLPSKSPNDSQLLV